VEVRGALRWRPIKCNPAPLQIYVKDFGLLPRLALNAKSPGRALRRPFPPEPMRMWPISTRVNKPENDGPSILEPVELSAA
jgi:hypothetical protein